MSDLDLFELLLAPETFRFTMAPFEPIVIRFETPPNPTIQASTYLISPADHPEIAGQVVKLLDSIVDKQRLFEMPAVDSDLAFAPAFLTVPSLHLRVGYGEFMWQSWYAKGTVPEELDGIIRECYGLALLLARSVPMASASPSVVSAQ
jgi:hypothetical protein